METIETYQTCTGNGGYLGLVDDACTLSARLLVARLNECGVQVSGDPDIQTECSVPLAKRGPCVDACLPKYDCACFTDPNATNTTAANFVCRAARAPLRGEQ